MNRCKHVGMFVCDFKTDFPSHISGIQIDRPSTQSHKTVKQRTDCVLLHNLKRRHRQQVGEIRRRQEPFL